MDRAKQKLQKLSYWSFLFKKKAKEHFEIQRQKGITSNAFPPPFYFFIINDLILFTPFVNIFLI